MTSVVEALKPNKKIIIIVYYDNTIIIIFDFSKRTTPAEACSGNQARNFYHYWNVIGL